MSTFISDKTVRTTGFSFTGTALKVSERYGGKVAQLVPDFRDTVLRGRKLSGAAI